jgi:hypothetical protein
MKRIVLFCYTLIILQAAATAQEAAPSLSGFFQERLAASPNMPPPSYDALLRVTDTIAGGSSDDIAEQRYAEGTGKDRGGKHGAHAAARGERPQ